MVGFWELSDLFRCESRWPAVGDGRPNERVLRSVVFVLKSYCSSLG